MTANKARQDRQRAYVPWYTYTPTLVPLPLYPWYPMPTTYIHTCIDTFVLFYLFILLSYCLYLSCSSLLSRSVSSRSLLALGKAYPWAGGSRPHLFCIRKRFILFNYYPVVYMYGMVCMYPHVLYSVCVYIIYYVCVQQMYVCT